MKNDYKTTSKIMIINFLLFKSLRSTWCLNLMLPLLYRFASDTKRIILRYCSI
jgi:hypothetical protein